MGCCEMLLAGLQWNPIGPGLPSSQHVLQDSSTCTFHGWKSRHVGEARSMCVCTFDERSQNKSTVLIFCTFHPFQSASGVTASAWQTKHLLTGL